MIRFAPFIAIFWAGIAVGATLIATPVKFLAPSLTLSTALEIGRVTFYWVGIAEAVLCAIFIIAVFAFGGTRWKLAFIPIALFAIQRLGLMPILDLRTVDIISGNPVTQNSLHDVYIYFEFAKIIALMVVGALGIFSIENENAASATYPSTSNE